MPLLPIIVPNRNMIRHTFHAQSVVRSSKWYGHMALSPHSMRRKVVLRKLNALILARDFFIGWPTIFLMQGVKYESEASTLSRHDSLNYRPGFLDPTWYIARAPPGKGRRRLSGLRPSYSTIPDYSNYQISTVRSAECCARIVLGRLYEAEQLGCASEL
ncbi:hypothetical protein IAQ61_006691 [Plenodomus lingam]|uniref:uncharacterized protein n=1 Tax=Leptosphaeria maculans TaxID=5022 RepID=UPI003322E210|nr:hypothetical protein IAQ61_006691 [Plenodomus lingam]